MELSLEEILLLNSDFSVIAHPLGETTTLYALTNGFDFSNQSVISRDLGLYRIPTISSNPESVTISEAEINGFVEIAIKLLLSHPDLNEANVWSWRTHSESATSARQINPINGMTVESDYNDTAGAGIFFEGDTEKVVIVRINDDSLEESSEYFELQIDTFLSEIRTDEGSIILRIPFFIIDNDVVSGVTEKDDALSVAEPKEINFGSNDSASRRLTILNQEVSAIFSDENWIHVDTLPGNMGEREISISVEENDSLFTRTGYINVDEARVLVNQAGSSETQPPEEINVTEGVHRDRVRISWSSIEGADGYRIYRTEDSAFDENGFLGSVEEITFFDDFSAEENVTFYYWIRAVGQMGPSIPSSTNSGFASSTTLETGNIWRDAEPTGDGWRLSKWFGFLNDSFFPWIFHITHGFQYLASGSLESDLFLYDFEMMDWWWTTNDIYPSFYSFNRSNFQFYFEGTQHPRFFVDFGTGEIWEF